MELLYPPPPNQVPVEVTQPTPAFRQEIRKVIFAIVLFILVYLILILLAVGFTVLCCLAGLSIIAVKPSLWTILIGAGLASMGVMVLFFLIKFLFSGSNKAGPQGIQLDEDEEPQLFGFIRNVAREVDTHFPKKIFLIPDVNASVFYSSSFWSLFFPTRKNLNIGMGLVNSVNISELKAVLGHEFGHFSQRSMRLGSYVYYVNQAIYNMLYQNTGWSGALNTIANIHGILAFFAQMAVYIVQAIQWILQQMYALINRQYLGLSRQMEFHADAIAASVAGSNNMIQALRQVAIGHLTYQHTLQKCNELAQENLAPADFYSGHRTVAAYFARDHKLGVDNGIPVATRDFVQRLHRTRVEYKDQWASHPTEAEREASLQQLDIQAEVLRDSARAIFRHPERWQSELTAMLYLGVVKPEGWKELPDEAFRKKYEADWNQYQFPGVFNGFYNNHQPAAIDLESIRQSQQAAVFDRAQFEVLFGENLSENLETTLQDIGILQAIESGNIPVKTFDFDGRKYPKAESSELLLRLKAEAETLMAAQKQQDEAVLRFFYGLALSGSPAKGEELLQAYQNLYAVQTMKDELEEPARAAFAAVNLMGQYGFVVAEGEPLEAFKALRFTLEPALRELFGKLVQESGIKPEAREKMQDYLAGKPDWLRQDVANAHFLEKLCGVISKVHGTMTDAYLARLKAVTEMQAKLIPEH